METDDPTHLNVLSTVHAKEALVSPSSSDQPFDSLIAATLRGDESASRSLFDAVGPIFVRAARRTLGTQSQELEDFVQDASLRFFRALSSFEGKSHIRRFAFKIATHTAADWIRGKSALKRSRVQPGLPENARSPHDPSRPMVRRRVWETLAKALSEKQLEAFVLRTVVGCSVVEIGEITGTNPGTVRSRLRSAKESLRQTVERHPDLLSPWSET